MSRCEIKLAMPECNTPQRIRHWENILLNGFCQDCGLGNQVVTPFPLEIPEVSNPEEPADEDTPDVGGEKVAEDEREAEL